MFDAYSTRTTLDLDEDILAAAKELASFHNTSVGKMISNLARQAMEPKNNRQKMRNGIPLLPSRPGVIVTTDLIDQIREEEGI